MKEFTDTELANEQWRDIEGYDGMYQVSDLGRVRSRKSGEWKIMKQDKSIKGYLNIGLCRDGKRKNISIHRLVADAFIQNDNIFNDQINHINEDKADNRASNLEWCDCRYNINYNDLQFRKKNSVRRKLKDLYNPNLTWYENIEIFKANGIECCRGTVVNLRKDLGLVRKYTKRS